MIELQEAKIILEGETRWVLNCNHQSDQVINRSLQVNFFSIPIGGKLFFSIPSGGKYYQKDGGRRGYEPEVFSRIFWEDNEAEEEEEERLELEKDPLA